MKSALYPHQVDELLGHVMMRKITKKSYFAKYHGFKILCVCRHPREALTSQQNYGRSRDWKNIMITRENKCILNICQDKYL